MIRFSKYLWVYFLISALVLVPGIYSLLRFGLNPSIDFTGGVTLELKSSGTLSQSYLSELVNSEKLPIVDIQSGQENTVTLRFKPVDSEKISALVPVIMKDSKQDVQILSISSVGPILGQELLTKSVYAAILAISGILLYVAYAFKNYKFGVSAVLALFHDLLVVLGCFSLFGHFLSIEVDALFVTAFLTTMSFSVHDTIVVFDRIREYSHRGYKGSFEDLCDMALTETMGRSLTNSFTIVFMLLALVLMGGNSTKWFSVALLIGTVSGTYSSPFVATPILILWDRFLKKRNKQF